MKRLQFQWPIGARHSLSGHLPDWAAVLEPRTQRGLQDACVKLRKLLDGHPQASRIRRNLQATRIRRDLLDAANASQKAQKWHPAQESAFRDYLAGFATAMNLIPGHSPRRYVTNDVIAMDEDWHTAMADMFVVHQGLIECLESKTVDDARTERRDEQAADATS